MYILNVFGSFLKHCTNWQNKTDTWELEIIMDNGAVDELITFFTDKSEPELLITFQSESATVWETEDLCRQVVRIQRNRVSLQRSLYVLLTSISSFQTE